MSSFNSFQIFLAVLLQWVKKNFLEHLASLKTNMSPENRWLEDVFPTEMVTF